MLPTSPNPKENWNNCIIPTRQCPFTILASSKSWGHVDLYVAENGIQHEKRKRSKLSAKKFYCWCALSYPYVYFTAPLIFYANSGSCSRANFIRDIILNFTTWEAVYRPFNYVFVEIEPSNANYMTFPIRYHQQRITNAFLNNSNPLHSQAWDNLVHVLVIRQPIEMSLSALTFAFPGNLCHLEYWQQRPLFFP